MRTVAQQESIGRLRQDQSEHEVAVRTLRSACPDRDHAQHLCEQLAHRDAHLEHVR